MAEVTLSYDEYQALLDRVNSLEKDRSEHIRLLDDKVGMVVQKRVSNAHFDMERLEYAIRNYPSYMLTVENLQHLIIETIEHEGYAGISDVGKEIADLNYKVKTLTDENNKLSEANAQYKQKLADNNAYMNDLREAHKDKLKSMQDRLDAYTVMETAYRKIEHYLEEIDTMVSHQKNLEDELEKLNVKFHRIKLATKNSLFGLRKKIKYILSY